MPPALSEIGNGARKAIIPPRRTFPVDTRNENLPEKGTHQSCANRPGQDAVPGFFVARRERHIAHGSTATFECGTWPRAEFHCLRIVIYNEFCNSDVLPARILFSAHAKR